MSKSLLVLLQENVSRNVTRRVAGGENALIPQLKVGTIPGSLQINAASGATMSLADGDYIAVGDFSIFEALGLPAAHMISENRPFYAGIYATDAGNSAKLNEVGSNLNFSNKNVHICLGGNSEMNRYFKLGKGIFGIVQLEGGEIAIADGELEGSTPVVAATVFNPETAQFEQLDEATTVADVYNNGKCLFPLSFFEEKAKASVAHLNLGRKKAADKKAAAVNAEVSADEDEEEVVFEGDPVDEDDDF